MTHAHSRHFRTLATAACVAGLAALGLLGCTGAGDGGAGSTGTFLASGALYSSFPPTTTERVFLTQVGSSRTSVCLAVDCGPVVDLFSVAFTLDFDPSVLDFSSWDASTSLLGTGGDVFVQVSAQPGPPATPNQVVVGITRNAASPSVMGGVTTAGGRFLTLCFDLVGPAAASPLTFTGTIGGWDSTPPPGPATQLLQPGEFYGGTIQVN